MVSARPYQQQLEHAALEDSIRSFSQTKTHRVAVKVAPQNEQKHKKKTLVYTRRQVLSSILAIFVIFVCLSVGIFVKAQISAKTTQLAVLTQETDVLVDQNETSKNILLSRIDGQNFDEYVQSVLGMEKRTGAKIRYINVQEKLKEREKNAEKQNNKRTN